MGPCLSEKGRILKHRATKSPGFFAYLVPFRVILVLFFSMVTAHEIFYKKWYVWHQGIVLHVWEYHLKDKLDAYHG